MNRAEVEASMTFFESWKSNQGNLLIMVAIATILVACAFWHFQLLPEIELQPAQVIGDNDVRVIDTRRTEPSVVTSFDETKDGYFEWEDSTQEEPAGTDEQPKDADAPSPSSESSPSDSPSSDSSRYDDES